MPVGAPSVLDRSGPLPAAQAVDNEIESALWIAMRSLQEKGKVSRRLAGQVHPGLLSERYESIADETEHAMAVLGHRLSGTYARSRGPDG